jgi:Male sterility protein
MGPRRLLALAKASRHIEIFTHVSTCYVNSDKRYSLLTNFIRGGFIEEKVYDYDNDPDEIYERLMKIPPEQLSK